MAGVVDLDPFLCAGSPIAGIRVEPEVSRLLAQGGMVVFWRAVLELASRHDAVESSVKDDEIFTEAGTRCAVVFRGNPKKSLDPKTGQEVAWEIEILMDKLPHLDAARYVLPVPVYSDAFDLIKTQLSVMALDTSRDPVIPGTIAIFEFTGDNKEPNHATLAHPKPYLKKLSGMKDARHDTHEYEAVTNVSDVTVNRLLSAVYRSVTND